MPQTPFPPSFDAAAVRQRLTPSGSPTPRSPAGPTEKEDASEADLKEETFGLSHPLLEFEQLPGWMKEFESEYTLVGYRREQRSLAGCCWSIVGYLHNETINIHTHLLGALVPLFLILSHHTDLFMPHYPSLTPIDLLHCTVFLMSAVVCLSCSAMYHTLSCHSQRVAKGWNQMDYVGIVALIVGSNYPAIYYGFYCDRPLQILYTTVITVLGMLAGFVVLSPTYTTGAYRWARTLIFLALGLSAVVPVTHNLLAYGFARARSEMGLGYLLSSGGLYIAGALLYAVRFPERRFPKTFDIVGSSHQIFHCCVIAAAWLHYRSIQTSMAYHHGVMGGQCRGDEI